MSHTASDFTREPPLVSRRWRPASREERGCTAGADCSACKVPCEAIWGYGWRCPKCGAKARGCGDVYGFKACELLAGHNGDHESPSGSSWKRRGP